MTAVVTWVYSEFFWAIIALTLVYSAYVAEVYRAGINSVHRSQVAAARSLGLPQWSSMRYVILPQAIRNIIPPLLNDFISLQKDTALVGLLGSIEAIASAASCLTAMGLVVFVAATIVVDFTRATRARLRVGESLLPALPLLSVGFLLPNADLLWRARRIALPERELRWIGRFLVPGLFDGEHSLRIERLDNNRSRFVQSERFSGLLVGLVKGTLAKTEAGFEQMNTALKARVEQASAQN